MGAGGAVVSRGGRKRTVSKGGECRVGIVTALREVIGRTGGHLEHREPRELFLMVLARSQKVVTIDVNGKGED